MSETAITTTLDRERRLDVRPLLMELERVTGTGIGKLVGRVVSGEYHAADLAETVRLGLMGAGTSPAEAATLAKVYVTERPLSEGHALATTVLMAAWAGTAKASEAVEPGVLADAGEVILDATGRNPMRVQNDGSLVPVERA